MSFFDIAKKVFNKLPKYSNIMPPDARLGTKVAICLVVFNCLLILWLLVGIPWLTIFYPVLGQYYAAYLDKIIIALIGGATATYTTNEVRKTIENVKIQTDETPKNPHGGE